MLKRTSPKLWLPTLAFVWGIVATLLGVVQNYPGFLVSRLFLGATESGLFPGVMFYLSMWYKREERHFRIALFFSAASLAGAFGGILAWVGTLSIVRLGYGSSSEGHCAYERSRRLWRMAMDLHHRILLLRQAFQAAPDFLTQEGILTVLVGACAFFLISNYPSSPDVKFLTLKEKQLIHNRLRDDSDATRHETFAWTNALKAFRDPKVWLYGLSFHTVALPLYTLSLFLPTIINQLGYTAAQAQLMTIPPYSVAFVLTVSLAFFAERAHARAPFIMGSSFLALCGYIILLATPSSLPGLAYFGTFLAAGGIYPSVALVFAWPANNVSGQTKRAVSNALQNSIGTLGAVLGTQLYRTETAPRFFLGHGFAAGYLATNILIVALLRWVLKRENVKRERGERDRRLQDLAEGEWLGDDDPRWRFQL